MIDAHQRTISKVLGDDYLHEIPPFQRPYAWRKTEAEQLLEDLIEASDPEANRSDYFLGSLVLIKLGAGSRVNVVDGQQRLTTLTILCAVLRDIATSEKERTALQKAVYVEPDPFAGITESLRLRPHAADAAFFLESIQKDQRTLQLTPALQPQNESQEFMWENAQAFHNRLSKISDKRRQELVVYLLNKCVIVTVETPTRSAALRIFKVLNDRGLDLSNADVIKADLLAKISDEEHIVNHFANIWRDLEVEIGRDEFEGLLEYIRFLHEKGKSRGTLSDAYEIRFKESDSSIIQNFIICELTPAKDALVEILRSDGRGFPAEIRQRAAEALAGLRLLPNKDWTPVALAIFQTHRLTQETVELLEKLEGLAWAQQLMRRYDTQRMARYARCLEALDGTFSYEREFSLTSDEKEKAAQALQGKIYNEYPVRVVRAILQRLDRLISDQPLFTEIMSVEHILPQSPVHPDWRIFSEEDCLHGTHRLGNLVLLSRRKNSSASNMPFQHKKKSYFGVGDGKWPTYASVNELALLENWTPEALRARQSRHCTILARRWGFESEIVSVGMNNLHNNQKAAENEVAREIDDEEAVYCNAKNYEILLQRAKSGELPPPPDFSAATHERYRSKLEELTRLVATGDVDALKSFQFLGPNASVITTSPKMMMRYRDLCIVALQSQ